MPAATREFQVYGVDARGLVTHAGVHKALRMSLATARRLQREWEAWRQGYLDTHPGDYPLRHMEPTVALCVEPLGHPEARRTFVLKGAQSCPPTAS